MVAACTIIARNYLAHARVLADSFLAHHQDGDFTVLIIDDEGRRFDARNERFRCLRLAEIGLSGSEIARLAGIYDVTELATAVKPQFLRHLLGEHRTDILYIDPDIKIFGSLAEASRLAREHSIVLTPHLTVPLPRDGRRVNDFHILSSGVYNLGFIALGRGCDAFIDWWWDKTRRDALVDHDRMMFTDQRWIDFVPGFFDHHILKDPTYNVAYWNLHARDLTWDGSRYFVNGQPLTFFHFSGFDTRKPHLLSKHQADRPRILLSERPGVARICQEYVTDLERAGLARESSLPYGWRTLPSGLVFDQRMRRLYRQGLEAFEKSKGAQPPDPFDPQQYEPFLAWLNEPVAEGMHPRVSRYLHAIYMDRPDLQAAFPDLAGSGCTDYFDWIRRDGVEQVSIPTELLPPPASERRELIYTPISQLTEGVNIAGYFRAELGIGEAARLLTSAVDAAGIPSSTVTYAATASRKAHPFADRGDGKAPHDINIVCVNADRTPDFAKAVGRQFFEGRYTVGYWFWELEEFPEMTHAGFDHVDEVWTATSFVTRAIEAVGRRPVFTIPLPVPIPQRSPAVTRGSLGLPPDFMFLFMFDFFSILERKNPLGLIDAFQLAFRPGEGPVLVIKTINGDSRLNDLERLRAAAGGRPDILIIDEYYSAQEKNTLLGLCDCYVSLHRSEGFGLTMAEAMGLEKPVIGTAYSGNLDFMTPENSYLVDYSLGSVPEGCEPYTVGSPWAEPNLDQAAALMRRVYEARPEAARKARMAREDIITKHHVEATAKVLARRLDNIRHARRDTVVTAPAVVTDEARIESARPEARLLAALDHLAEHLTPVSSVQPGRPFRSLILMAQEGLFKVLRPYWWQQRHIQESLLNVVRQAVQSAVRAEQSEPHQRQALEAIWRAVHALERSRDQVRRAHEEQLRTSGAEAERLAEVERGVATLHESTTTFQQSAERLAEVERGIATLHESTTTFQQSAAAHLQALTSQLEAVTTSNAILQQRLYAVPYMDDPDRFRFTDGTGRIVLGFQSRRGLGGDTYLAFEDIFRGSEAFIQERFRVYLPFLKSHARVVEIACGRGELLDVLSEAGVPACGVDVDDAMVRRCRAKGHAVEKRDALSFLREQADGSLPAIFTAQFVEHLSYPDLMSFLELSRAKLKAGGQLIFETVNPHSLEAFKTFWTDLTHQRPIFPEVAVALCWLLDFDQAYVFFPNGSGDIEKDRASRGEYAVVATKCGDD
ncbi:MAG TPA: methyltransferase domain-containing protein [Vicinamibacterales bacterium]|nr:methyltransferase domain-containing protein [Vicinamibacterales bacterium]